MKPDFLPSSPNSSLLGSNKRGFLNHLQESPTARRAKKVKKTRKHRFKNRENTRLEQRKRLMIDNPWEHNVVDQNQISDKPSPALFLREEDETAHALKLEDEDIANRRERSLDIVGHGIEHSGNWLQPQTAYGTPRPFDKASSSETRAKYRPDEGPKYPIGDGMYEIPAVPGSSNRGLNRQPAHELRELTPIGGVVPDRGSAFRAHPNQVPTPLPPAVQTPKEPRGQERGASTTVSPMSNSRRVEAPFLEPSQASKEEHTIPSSPVEPTAATNTTTMVATMTDASPPPASTKVLKAINRRLKALESGLAAFSASTTRTEEKPLLPKKEIKALRTDIARLHERLDREELRAAFRHSMLFNSLTKLAGDVGMLSGEVALLLRGCGWEQAEGGDQPTDGAGQDSRQRTTKNMQQSRKTLEQCLRKYTEDMNRAESKDDVAKYGGLVVKYAGDLFKTFG
ncbi:hypothetical protein VTH06DRAFT_5644 [Thermothelomyces fergusii]